ncbi:hypothetical protein OAW18_07320 [Alphaproteobacteria bacterium]|nr:hypothetical protein [Alphaproteobacteria bacterium]
MLYYYIGEIANVNAVFCDAGDSDGGGGGGDHQNDGHGNDAPFPMGMKRLLGAPPAPVKHRHQ